MSSDRSKILFVCTEDWFFKSHLLPLAKVSISSGDYDASLLTTVESTREEVEVLGLKVIPLDFMRSSTSKYSAISLPDARPHLNYRGGDPRRFPL